VSFSEPRPRVVVCGTGFGRIYLDGITAPGSPFELAGILARGSSRSEECGRRYGVPLFRAAAELPDDVDIACVVVGSAPTGGLGAQLAVDLMDRGMHVLQEHPLHAGEIVSCLRAARRNGVQYRVNSLHVHVPQVRRFICAAQALLRRQPALFVDATAGFQTLYSLLDILGSALGTLRPWGFAAAAKLPAQVRSLARADRPYRCLDGVLAGIPVTLRIQHQLDPAQPNNHIFVWHRITIGTEGGNLTLMGSAGPTLWCPQPHLPESAADAAGYDRLSEPYLQFASVSSIGPAAAPSLRDVLGSSWPRGVLVALTGLWEGACQAADSMPAGQYHLALCELTQDILEVLGRVGLLTRATPRVLAAEDIDESGECI
jgi:pyochelin biosynthesis protein PchG